MNPRWQNPEDRDDFWRWLQARAPSQSIEYRFFTGSLGIELHRDEQQAHVMIARIELETVQVGWRSLVAAHIWDLRRKLRCAKAIETDPRFSVFRHDGWPLCPRCGADALDATDGHRFIRPITLDKALASAFTCAHCGCEVPSIATFAHAHQVARAILRMRNGEVDGHA